MARVQKKKTKTEAPSKASVIFFTTFDSREEANVFARHVVTEKLAACVNILPHISSVYAWQGAIHEDAEILLIGKTTASQFKKLKSQIKALHSYKLPELICFKIEDGYPEYLKWIATSVKPV